MKILLQIFGTPLLSLFWVSSAQASFGCDVLPFPGGFIELHDAPDATSPVLSNVPVGINVSLFDGDEDVSGAWVRVAYSTNPDAW